WHQRAEHFAGEAAMKPTGHRTPLSVWLSVLLLWAGLNVYWWWTFTGAFRWVAELQLRRSHSYNVALTVPTNLLGTAVLAWLVVLVLSRFGVFDRLGGDGASAHRLGRLLDWCLAHGLALSGCALAAGLVLVGFFHFWEGRTAGPLLSLNAAQF